MNDVISRFRSTSEVGDVDGFMELIHPEAELFSPILGRFVVRGERDLRTLFTAVYGSLKGLKWVDQVADERLALLRGQARIGPVRLDDAMVLELDPADGRIRTIRPHFRPWLGITAFALIVGAKLARHPGLFLRAARYPGPTGPMTLSAGGAP